MNFFQKIKTGRLFHKKNEPDILIKFIFMNTTYIVEEFEMSFDQELNSKGLPGGLPRGGIMTLTFSETPDYYINEWMLKEEIVRDGIIRFFPNKFKIEESALLTISFYSAYCIHYKKVINTEKGGLFTTIVISPRSIKMGNEEFENNWKKIESLSHYIRSN